LFDVETTGTDRRRDQVIELCMQLGLDGEHGIRTWRFKPTVSIHPGAQAVHGITIEDLADCPSFASCADEVTAVFAEVDVIIGYNLAFDIDMLRAEYERMGATPPDFAGKSIVDPFRLWQQCEPRSLQHAHRRFVGDSFAAAHSASADVAATGRVLRGMLRAFQLEDKGWTQIAGVCDPMASSGVKWVGPSRHLYWDDAQQVVLAIGKYSGTAVHELARGRETRGFLRWMLEKDFPNHVHEVVKQALDLRPDDFLAWARRRYGQPAPTKEPPFTASQS
jgi:DNA polymerase-3 subunit epsilon